MPNEITPQNAGWRTQFRFAGSVAWPGVCEFHRWGNKARAAMKIALGLTIMLGEFAARSKPADLVVVPPPPPSALAASGTTNKPTPFVHPRVDVLATVKPDRQFRLYQKRPRDNTWDDGRPYPGTNALTVLRALSTAKPWDGKSHAVAYGMLHAYEPPLALCLAWCKDIKDKKQRDTESIHICSGNWLFWYGDHIYQLTEEAHQVLTRVFVENK